MKYEFSFQKVLDVKEKEKEAAKNEFGSSKQRQMELEEKLEGLEVEKEKVYNQYNDVTRKTVWEFLEVQQELDHFNLQVKQLTHQSKQLHQEVELKHEVLIAKTKEAKVWNLWKDKSKNAFQMEQARKEQAMLDEMAVLRYSRRV
jgi:flagellar FliJ protein